MNKELVLRNTPCEYNFLQFGSSRARSSEEDAVCPYGRHNKNCETYKCTLFLGHEVVKRIILDNLDPTDEIITSLSKKELSSSAEIYPTKSYLYSPGGIFFDETEDPLPWIIWYVKLILSGETAKRFPFGN